MREVIATLLRPLRLDEAVVSYIIDILCAEDSEIATKDDLVEAVGDLVGDEDVCNQLWSHISVRAVEPSTIDESGPQRLAESIIPGAEPSAEPVQAAQLLPTRNAGPIEEEEKETPLRSRAAVTDAYVASSDRFLDEVDAYTAEWELCRKKGYVWGGASRGGRGLQRRVGEPKEVIVEQVSLVYDCVALLEEARLCFVEGRRYALIGPNGSGKSTLLRRMARCSIPGYPRHLSTLHVVQEVAGNEETALECLLNADTRRIELLAEQERITKALEAGDDDADIDALTAVTEELQLVDSPDTEHRARKILHGLGFNKAMLRQPTSELSGGWRMLTALAQALFLEPDVLLLDEPNSHLSPGATAWLENYLADECQSSIIVVVSHDSVFLDAVCTDICFIKNLQLNYYQGKYSSWIADKANKNRRNANKAGARDKQKEHLQGFITRQRQSTRKKKGNDPKKQRQIRSKQKRMERLGKFRQDGKYWRKFCLYLPDDLDQIMASTAPERPVKFAWPQPEHITDLPLIQLSEVAIGYAHPLLSDVTVSICESSRIVVCGMNGVGKSTLLSCVMGMIEPLEGDVFRHRNVKIGYMAQHHIEALDPELRPQEHLALLARDIINPVVPHDAIDGDWRAYLGSFGVHGSMVGRRIALMSGGQKARLAIAAALLSRPHVVLLDEPTNYLDHESLIGLSEAIKAFNGAVVIVSHAQGFILQTCNELWTVGDGTVEVRCEPDEDDDPEDNSVLAGAYFAYKQEQLESLHF